MVRRCKAINVLVMRRGETVHAIAKVVQTVVIVVAARCAARRRRGGGSVLN